MTTKIGVVGGGQIVESMHLPTLSVLPDVEVLWVCDPAAHRRQILKQMFGIPGITPAEFEEKCTAADACLLATPIGVRNAYLEACQRYRVAVLVEKPFALTQARHRDLLNRFPKHMLAVGYQRRSYRTVSLVKKVLEDGLFGTLERINIAIGGYDLKSGGSHRYITDPAMSGGGVFAELGVHACDQALMLINAQTISNVHANGVIFDGIDYEVRLCAEASTPHGTIPIEGVVTRMRPIHQHTRFEFENATLSMPHLPHGPIEITPHNHREPYVLDNRHVKGAESIAAAFLAEWKTFLSGFTEKTTTWVSAESSLATTALIENVHQALDD